MQRNKISLRFVILLIAGAFASVGIKGQSPEDSNLPVILIDTRGEVIEDDPKINVILKVIDNITGIPGSLAGRLPDYDGEAAIEIRGQSSQMFPKKSYSFELRTVTGADSSASLLGMPAEEDWVLYAPYSDKTLLRNALTFYLGSRMGGWQPRYRFCELFLNGEYNGVYMLLESIKHDSSRVNISKINPDEISGDDLTGGYIIKGDKIQGVSPDRYFVITPSQHYEGSRDYPFTYVYPDYDEIVPQQKDYIRRFLTEAEEALNGESFNDPATGFRKYFDVSSFVDFQIIQEIVNNVDGYRYSTFFYKDKDSHGGKLHAGPLWDFDLCYGNEDYADFNLETDIWLYTKFSDEYGNRMHWWARMMEDLGYRAVFTSRWKQLRREAFATDSVMAFIDNSIMLLGDAIDRNFAKWPILGTYVWPNFFIGADYGEEVGYLTQWLKDRMTWIDGNIVNADNFTSASTQQDIVVYPNPVNNLMNLYFLLDQPGDIRIEIFNLTGKVVFRSNYQPDAAGYQNISFNVSMLTPGFYMLRVTQANRQVARKKILVNHR